jgi:hypothetical protein
VSGPHFATRGGVSTGGGLPITLTRCRRGRGDRCGDPASLTEQTICYNASHRACQTFRLSLASVALAQAHNLFPPLNKPAFPDLSPQMRGFLYTWHRRSLSADTGVLAMRIPILHFAATVTCNVLPLVVLLALLPSI